MVLPGCVARCCEGVIGEKADDNDVVAVVVSGVDVTRPLLSATITSLSTMLHLNL